MEEELINDLAKRINLEKENIINNRLKELMINVDYEAVKKMRFKPFITERNEDSETIYYNDGSIDGLRVVTFKNKVNLTLDNKLMTNEIEYY